LDVFEKPSRPFRHVNLRSAVEVWLCEYIGVVFFSYAIKYPHLVGAFLFVLARIPFDFKSSEAFFAKSLRRFLQKYLKVVVANWFC